MFGFSTRKPLLPCEKIPLGNLQTELYIYDTAWPRMGKLVFIRDLCTKYKCQRKI